MAKGDLAAHWISSARADLRVARTVFRGRHWRHVVFLSHLCVEKSLKALLQKESGRLPPKTHDLVALVQRLKRKPPAELDAFIGELSQLSVPTRYPDDLRKAGAVFDARFADRCLRMSAKVFRWSEQAVK